MLFRTAPSMPPQSLSVIITTSKSLEISWEPPPSESNNGIIREYAVVIYSFHTGIEQYFTTVNKNYSLSDLHPYTIYSIKVAAVTVETGPFTYPYNVTTFEDGISVCYELFSFINYFYFVFHRSI